MPRHLTGDAHEWINEIPTVPTYSLANLQPSQRSWVYLCVITFDVTRNYFFRQGFFVFYNKPCYEQQRGKKTLLSLTLICYCHLVGMAKIVRGSTFVRPWNTATWRFGWLTVLVWHCLDLYYKLTCALFKVVWHQWLLWILPFELIFGFVWTAVLIVAFAFQVCRHLWFDYPVSLLHVFSVLCSLCFQSF